MNPISRHLLSKFQVSPEDTFDRLRRLDIPDHLRAWAGSVIWWNGGCLEMFARFADDCPCLTSSEYKFDEIALDLVLESVGFHLEANSWQSSGFSEECVSAGLDHF